MWRLVEHNVTHYIRSQLQFSVADLGGGEGRVPRPPAQNFFIFVVGAINNNVYVFICRRGLLANVSVGVSVQLSI